MKIGGLSKTAKSFFISSLNEVPAVKIIISSHLNETEELFTEIPLFLSLEKKSKIALFPPREENEDTLRERIKTLHLILQKKLEFLITPLAVWPEKIISPEEFTKLTFSIPGQKRNELIEKLISSSYSRVPFVERIGDFSVRGGIVDFFTPSLTNPVRIEFIGDEIESMRIFDLYAQRSIERIESVDVLPVNESGQSFLGDFLFGNDLCFIFDEEKKEIEEELKNHFAQKFPGSKKLNLFLFSENLDQSCETQIIPSFRGDFKELEKKIDQWLQSNYLIKIFTLQPHRLEEIFQENNVVYPQKNLIIEKGSPRNGFIYDHKFVLLTDYEIFGRSSRFIARPTAREEISFRYLEDFNFGDYVVHKYHGIGIYEGLEHLKMGQIDSEYILLRYANHDKLYVPLEQMKYVKKYVGNRPLLHRLGGMDWVRTRRRIKQAALDQAQELMRHYYLRKKTSGFSFSVDSPWQKEIEEVFPYLETVDQKKAIDEVKKDMEKTMPMERLICGDVGYGKTEVALRAAFKAAVDGKQVAFLAPTTILAEQHYNTFSSRLVSYPLVVEMLSRFRSEREQKEILKNLAAGAVDIIIGTHRLLHDDVKFKDLGLLIIDEEQRFGVMHKEKIKKLARHIDVLYLTATPIPRTLQMALSGLTDISIINTAPQERLPIKTFVAAGGEKIVQNIIRKELEREGQVYFVHNRINTIFKKNEFLKKLIPEARIGISHGKLDEKELEEVMIKFIHGEFDILLSTSIIEIGLDIPNVNTIIIDEVENFGLSQLYQLRGRVGRSHRQAYAYLFYHPQKGISAKAKERLKVIKDFTQLGSGFKIAMKDLEIRGAGNILGTQQHGFINAVGFEEYCEIMNEAVKELKGEKVETPFETEIELDIPAFIPQSFVEDDRQRIILYKRLLNINSKDEIQELKEELKDRFGRFPQELENLWKIVEIRLLCHELKIAKISRMKNLINIYFADGVIKNFPFLKEDPLGNLIKKL